MEAQAAFVRTDGAVHLNAKTSVDVHLALVVHPGHPEHDHPFGFHNALDGIGAAILGIAIKNRLADYENHVADYYLRRGAFVAALNRATRSLEQYNGATGNARSLQIMAEAYDALGMTELAADTRRVLAENFPGES